MNLLFIHQNFPGQYRNIVQRLAGFGKHSIVSISAEAIRESLPPSVQSARYLITRGNTAGIHSWALETETKIIRGEACGIVANQLHKQGFRPDLICAHPGWGESLYLAGRKQLAAK